MGAGWSEWQLPEWEPDEGCEEEGGRWCVDSMTRLRVDAFDDAAYVGDDAGDACADASEVSAMPGDELHIVTGDTNGFTEVAVAHPEGQRGWVRSHYLIRAQDWSARPGWVVSTYCPPFTLEDLTRHGHDCYRDPPRGYAGTQVLSLTGQARGDPLSVQEGVCCELFEVPPNGAAWPMQRTHRAEGVYIVAGRATLLRDGFDSERQVAELEEGDFIHLDSGPMPTSCCPPDPAPAVQVLNADPEEPLRFLMVGVQPCCEVLQQPGTQPEVKVGYRAPAAPNGGRGWFSLADRQALSAQDGDSPRPGPGAAGSGRSGQRSSLPPFACDAHEVPQVAFPSGLPPEISGSFGNAPPGYGGFIQDLSAAAGAGWARLGCDILEMPAGHALWPKHAHAATDQAFYVLSGEGSAWVDGDSCPLSAGDYVHVTAGRFHQICATAESRLRLLCFLNRESRADVMIARFGDKARDRVLLRAEGELHCFRVRQAHHFWAGVVPSDGDAETLHRRDCRQGQVPEPQMPISCSLCAMYPLDGAVEDWADSVKDPPRGYRGGLWCDLRSGDAPRPLPGHLGACLFEIAHGSTAFPAASEASSEEAYFIIAGSGLLRWSQPGCEGVQRCHIGVGDYIDCPASCKRTVQLVSTGGEALRYLRFMAEPFCSVAARRQGDLVGYAAPMLEHFHGRGRAWGGKRWYARRDRCAFFEGAPPLRTPPPPPFEKEWSWVVPPNECDWEWVPEEHEGEIHARGLRGGYGGRAKKLSYSVGGTGCRLSVELVEVEPRRAVLPRYGLLGLYEAFFVLSGEAEVVAVDPSGAECRFELGPGMYVQFEPGLQKMRTISNCGKRTLRYIRAETGGRAGAVTWIRDEEVLMRCPTREVYCFPLAAQRSMFDGVEPLPEAAPVQDSPVKPLQNA
eukprot:TRINITY_DN15754_c0_g1_i1.p1 TRINITY_DN15754_c0_g1~~TRINITY_DN15754_c0_g1_i1.p1  ORF type:complete len:925 (+),score=268.12 TRINITY_DN15754_c0_g1_i1:61-2775(+)